jgi:glutamyl/glutaminyl-tRNA synthetase
MFLPTSKINFDALADTATSHFFNNPGASLKDQVVKLATDNNLNPEEIKRLVEKTNISATKKVLASVKDRRAEVELVDSSDILQSTHSSPEMKEPEMEKSASLREDFMAVADSKKAAYSQATEVLNSFKQQFKKEASENPYRQQKENLQVFFKERAEKSKLQMDKMAQELQVKNDIDYLISEFSKYYPPDFNKFANEAYTLHGDTVLPILRSMKAYLEPRTKNMASDFEKVAGVIDDRTVLLTKIAAVKDTLISLVSINKRLAGLNPILVIPKS